ncbi:hypothetical protein M514_26847 [Trichuris suis]|uniref:Uncharacterized protein n=1 Tax=Trichuris suis TaxID=68888 RepID=A0A085MUQ3_9BILA|nr:hypothetical protein M514_26847 [Trichuris suis]
MLAFIVASSAARNVRSTKCMFKESAQLHVVLFWFEEQVPGVHSAMSVSASGELAYEGGEVSLIEEND